MYTIMKSCTRISGVIENLFYCYLYPTESWKLYMDEGEVFGATFIDFRKAFDSVRPEILFCKIQSSGISGKLGDC